MGSLKILVSGAGIAGNAIAFWLSGLGHEVTVVEWYPELRASGLQVDLRGPGIEALKCMGLEKAFRDHQVIENGMQVVNKSGAQVAFFPTNRSGSGVQNFSSDFEILRGDLCQVLYDACKDRVNFIFAAQISTIQHQDGGVDVTLSNGTTDVYDLIIAADGVGSKTRKMMYTNDDGFRPLGDSRMAYFTTKAPIEAGNLYNATWYLATSSRFIMTRRHKKDVTQVYLFCHKSSTILDNTKRDVEAQKKLFAEIFRGAGWKVDQLVDTMMDSSDFYCEHLGLVKLDSWFRDRFVLLGDAAWCPTVNTGMGTTSALTGAYILAGELSKHCPKDSPHNQTIVGLKAALESYDNIYRPFMTAVQKDVEGGSDWMPKSKLGIISTNLLLKAVALLKINWFGEKVLKEGAIKDFKLPDYPALAAIVR